MLYMQGLSDFMLGRDKHDRKSRSGKMNLTDRVPLQKLVIVELVEALSAQRSMQMTEKLQNQQAYCVFHGPRAPPLSALHLFTVVT